MKDSILVHIIALLVTTLKDKKTQDEILDFFEDLIARSRTKLDDRALLPLIQAYRQFADVPDNDQEEARG